MVLTEVLEPQPSVFLDPRRGLPILPVEMPEIPTAPDAPVVYLRHQRPPTVLHPEVAWLRPGTFRATRNLCPHLS